VIFITYHCKIGSCQFESGERRTIRKHIKEVHKIKSSKHVGGPAGKYYESPVSGAYERRSG